MRLHLYLLVILFLTSCQKENTQKLEYFFSEEVNSEIDSKISSYEDSPEWRFYLTVRRVVYPDDCGNYQILITSYKDQPIDFIRNILMNSGHFYRTSKGVEVPIVFDYDFSFLSHGIDRNGRVIRKNVTGNSYFIEFTKTGKIVNSGD